MIRVLRPNKRHIALINKLSEFMQDNFIEIKQTNNGESGIIIKIGDTNYFLQKSEVFPPEFEEANFAMCNDEGMVFTFDENYKPLY